MHCLNHSALQILWEFKEILLYQVRDKIFDCLGVMIYIVAFKVFEHCVNRLVIKLVLSNMQRRLFVEVLNYGNVVNDVIDVLEVGLGHLEYGF